MVQKQKILIIVGPTASGKSALAVTLAHKFKGEVISADSRQVYKSLDIGTGKITKREMMGIPHHLLDVSSPKNIFTAHDFIQRGNIAITDISSRGELPIVAGGTGFYIDALTGRIALPNVKANPAIRARLQKKTILQLFAQLQKSDPRRARKIDRKNKRRLIRALEIAQKLGKSPIPSSTQIYDTLWIGIAPSEKDLKQKISIRLFSRISRGMVAEAKRLHVGGLSYRRMGELGLEYRSLARFLQKKITREQMRDEMMRGNYLYAKRQMTYWKRNRSIKWFLPSQTGKMSRTVDKWLKI